MGDFPLFFRMKNEFRQRATSLYQRLKGLSGEGEWRNELEAAFSSVNFSGTQLQAIGQAATPTCLKNISDGQGGAIELSLPYNLTHAFTDPVRNSAQCIQIMGDEKIDIEGDFSLGVLVRARYALKDIVHNYPLLLGDAMPPSVREIVVRYENEILPEMDGLIAQLSQETGIDPETFGPVDHWQHLNRLDPAAFS